MGRYPFYNGYYIDLYVLFLYTGDMINAIDKLDFIIWKDVQNQLAKDIKRLRLTVKGWKRDTLAKHSGVPSSTIKRFETTGEISLRQFLMLVQSLGMLNRMNKLLEIDIEGMRMDDLLKQMERKERKRGSA